MFSLVFLLSEDGGASSMCNLYIVSVCLSTEEDMLDCVLEVMKCPKMILRLGTSGEEK